MTKDRGGGALRHIRTLFSVGTVGSLTDGQLLERFLTQSGDAAQMAFAALVERHGPMVLHVCQRVLADQHDAQDAFQATFLVLLRRAGSIRQAESLASWLHGAAFRTASCARSAAARRRRHERGAAARRAEWDCRERSWDDLGPVLHEELERMPERYREVIVLCDLEGATYDDTARALALPLGTVKSRLARGRDRLRERLIRRGWAQPGILGGLAPCFVAPPTRLMERTIQAASLVAAGQVPAGVVPVSVGLLMEGAMRVMFTSKLKSAMAVLFVGGFIASGGIVLAFQASESAQVNASSETKAQAKGANPTAESRDRQPSPPNAARWERLRVEILDAHNRNARRIHVLKARPELVIRIGEGPDWKTARALSGRLVIETPSNMKLALSHETGVLGDFGRNEKEYWYWFKDKTQKALYYCNLDDPMMSHLTPVLQPDWIKEALGLRVIPETEVAETTVTPGELGTLVLTHPPHQTGGVTYTRVTVVDAATQQIREHQLRRGDQKTILARSVVPEGYMSVPIASDSGSGNDSVLIPKRLKISWVKQRLEVDVAFAKDVRVNQPIKQSQRELLSAEPQLGKNGSRINLADRTENESPRGVPVREVEEP